MRYQVPQFIEMEPKIVGPFTLRQFIFVAIGAVIIFFLHFALSGVFFIIASLPIAIIFAALAFAKPEGIPLPKYIGITLSFLLSGKKYSYTNESASQQMGQIIPSEEGRKEAVAAQEQQEATKTKEGDVIIEKYQ
ncbi:MAG: hypothetical protein CEN90_501 [Parcubacteria group bacterium Licking1014_17]|nr:MAG: hypothetical protein CEN90_501 [Parcubacteria group bacterium Licking1014_17]